MKKETVKKDIDKHKVFMYALADARVLNTLVVSLHILVPSFSLNS